MIMAKAAADCLPVKKKECRVGDRIIRCIAMRHRRSQIRAIRSSLGGYVNFLSELLLA